RHSTTAGEAFAAMARNYSSHSQGAKYRIEIEGPDASLIREGQIPSLKHDRRLQDLSLADFFRFFRLLCGPGFQAHGISCTYAEPADVRPYEEFFGCPVRFGRERQAIEFAASWLDHPIATPDPLMETILE